MRPTDPRIAINKTELEFDPTLLRSIISSPLETSSSIKYAMLRIQEMDSIKTFLDENLTTIFCDNLRSLIKITYF